MVSFEPSDRRRASPLASLCCVFRTEVQVDMPPCVGVPSANPTYNQKLNGRAAFHLQASVKHGRMVAMYTCVSLDIAGWRDSPRVCAYCAPGT